jgi:hypothetical protein
MGMRLRMRSAVIAFAAVHAALGVIAARADGFTLDEGLGGAAFRGDFANTGGSPRLQGGVTYMRGAWGASVFGAGFMPGFGYVDCYGVECAYAAKPVDSFAMFGVDVRHTFPLVHVQKYPRLRIDMVLHAGPRYFWGADNIDNYSGPGIGGGAGLDFDLAVFGMFVDFGTDTTVMHRDGSPELAGSLPYIQIGGRLGWM